MRMKSTRVLSAAKWLVCAAGLAASAAANAQTIFYSENFDSAVPNQLSGDPRVTNACTGNTPSFTHTPPAGWGWNGCGVSTFNCRNGGCPVGPIVTCSRCPNVSGVREWEGWSFANKAFWVRVAGDQNRSQFTKGVGVVAIADPDEWDDIGSPVSNCGFFNAFMTTPAIDLASITEGSLNFTFDSSWRDESFDDGDGSNNQTAKIKAVYTVGGVEQAPVDVLHWDSDNGNGPSGVPSPFFHDDNTNETVILGMSELNVPAGATSVRFEFGLTNAGNDWWWAVDNLVVTADAAGTPVTLFAENFEGVTLEAPVNEVPTGCGVTYCGEFTHTHDGPNGVNVVVDSPATGGVPDWRGWSFVERSFWTCASGGPNGSAFTNSSGRLAVADGDEFDDVTHSAGPLDTTLSTPAIDVSGRVGSLLVLSFDSSWRWEPGQTAWVTARFNDAAGTVTEVQRFVSNPADPFFKADAVNERIATGFEVPSDATTVAFDFRYEGGNNWWWAIDNISVFEGIATVPVAFATPVQANMGVAPSTDYASCFTPWSPNAPLGWSNVFAPIGSCPTECGRPEWRGWTFASQSWWSTQVDTQGREGFTNARGFVAIADPDEWDDFNNGRSSFNAFLTTPSIPLAGVINSASLTFDSSWQYEGFDDQCSCDPEGTVTPINNQTAKIKAVYTIGGVDQAPVDVLHWDSDNGSNSGTGVPSPFLHLDNVNEAVTVDFSSLQIPAGASAVKFEFSLTNARNDWWWAMDNIRFNANGNELFTENFDTVPGKQAAPTENAPINECLYFSSVSAQGGGFTVENSGCAGNSTDFTGFNAWLVDAWALAGGGSRVEHLAQSAFISDFAQAGCNGQSRLISPNYSIGTINQGSLTLSFRSGWLAQAGHASSVEVSYNGGAWSPVISWNSGNKATAVDEIVTVALNNPSGATTARIRFNDGVSGWWAISEIAVSGEVGTAICPQCAADFNLDGGVDGSDIEAFFVAWESGASCGDTNLDGGVDGGDIEAFFLVWEQGGC